MSQQGKARLVTYLNENCTQPLETDQLDLGETMIDDGHVEISKLYVRNEGDRTWHITSAELTNRPDVKFSWDKTEVHPNEVLHLTLEWFTELVVDDLKYGFKLLGKYYPFSEG